MVKSNRTRFAALSLWTLCACAPSAATRYDEMASTFIANQVGGSYSGFEVEKLGPDRWNVTFEGNSVTSEDTAQTYGLYRCAILALQNAYDGFEILSNITLDAPASTPYERMPNSGTRAVGTALGGMVVGEALAQSVGTPFLVFSSDVKLVKKPYVGVPPKVFDAATLKAALEPYVMGMKCDKGNVCPHDHSYLRPSDGNAAPR